MYSDYVPVKLDHNHLVILDLLMSLKATGVILDARFLQDIDKNSLPNKMDSAEKKKKKKGAA